MYYEFGLLEHFEYIDTLVHKIYYCLKPGGLHIHSVVTKKFSTMTLRNWTPEQRQRQRELIQRWKPWQQSTGAKTPEGKKGSSHNAYKTSKSLEFREFIKFINRLLKDQKDLIR